MAKKSTNTQKKTNLALQGGGAHGAFTWGVLERLLQEERLEFDAVSATSAGALNAVILAQGMLDGGRHGAIKHLESFWRKISNIALFSPIQPTLMDKVFKTKNLNFSPSFFAAEYFTKMFSPYQYNIFDFNPLKNILGEMVDFKALSSKSSLKIFINATNVKTGKIKIFSNTDNLTIEKVMASSCLPYLYKAVEVDGESYWDGGYSGNPALYPLFYKSSSQDIIIVQINPIYKSDVPITATDILDRINEISFNATLMREIRAIAFVKKLLAEHKVSDDRYRDIKIHMIEAEEIMSSLSYLSKMNMDWDFITYLRDVGRQTADEWVKSSLEKVNIEASIDIYEKFL